MQPTSPSQRVERENECKENCPSTKPRNKLEVHIHNFWESQESVRFPMQKAHVYIPDLKKDVWLTTDAKGYTSLEKPSETKQAPHSRVVRVSLEILERLQSEGAVLAPLCHSVVVKEGY